MHYTLPAFYIIATKHILMLLIVSLVVTNGSSQKRNTKNKAIFLEDVSWTTAQKLLTPDAVVVIPLGAQSKEHGPHLPLCTDYLQATDCANRIALERNIIIAPVLNTGFYPAFIKYPGSITLSYSTSVEEILQTIRCLADYGPKRFYIINIGISTTPTLQTAAAILAEAGILLSYSDYNRPRFSQPMGAIATEAYTGHADEIETSSVLSIRPYLVDMSKAVNDSSMKGKTGMMSPVELAGGNVNKSGINGYAALATAAKGKAVMKVFSDSVLSEIDSAASCALPVIKDRADEYKIYEGDYTDSSNTKLHVMQKNNTLYFLVNSRDLTGYFHFYRDAADYFTSTLINVLFLRNENGEVIKAWCQNRDKTFWLSKIK